MQTGDVLFCLTPAKLFARQAFIHHCAFTRGVGGDKGLVKIEPYKSSV
jgi:hypothetical protein